VDCTFWIYDAVADRFQPLSKAQLGALNAQEVHRIGPHSVLQYVDSRKMHFWPGDKADYWLDLAAMKMTVRPVAQGEPRIPRETGQHNGCYDPKRDRVYVGGGNYGGALQVSKDIAAPTDNFFYYDVKADRWVKPDPKGKFPIFWGVGESFVSYDTVHDKLVIMQFNHHIKKEDRLIYVYDPDKNEFADPIAPTDLPGNVGHGFFCPELNVFVIQIAGGDNRVADTWVWRYKRAPEKK
jgi:hypothetical protein